MKHYSDPNLIVRDPFTTGTNAPQSWSQYLLWIVIGCYLYMIAPSIETIATNGAVHALLVALVIAAAYFGRDFRRNTASNRHPVTQDGASKAITDHDGLFRSAFDHAAGMALVSSDGRWLTVNQSLCKTLGYAEAELLDISFHDVTHPNDLGTVLIQINKLLNGNISSYQAEQRYIHKLGHTVWVFLSISLVRNSQAGPAHFVFQVQDITERKEAEERLIHDVFHDALTGLPNRALFMDRLGLAIERARRRTDVVFAALFIDLDGFKAVNDDLGHIIGDRLLIEIARRLRKSLRATDTIARFGGDEFTVLLEDLSDQGEAIRLVKRVQKELARPFQLSGHRAQVTASIGIASKISSYQLAEEIVRDADAAMYQAKAAGKARYKVFEENRRARSKGSLVQTDLSQAIDRRQLLLCYQPIVSLEAGKLLGFEALVRWNHPERGIIFPVDFIRVAEETGAINSIGQWVLREACYQLRQWHDQFPFHRSLHMSVNLSSKQFTQHDLIDQILAILQETSVDPRTLKLEITESVLMESLETSTVMLQQLRALGVELSIDDFGTGYSSLSYLHRLPINNLKIDQSFVRSLVKNDENIEIVRTIVSLARNLGLSVIAEGVETMKQLAQLRLLKCDGAQGFLFSKPVEPKTAATLMENGTRWQAAIASLEKRSRVERPEHLNSHHIINADSSRSLVLLRAG